MKTTSLDRLETNSRCTAVFSSSDRRAGGNWESIGKKVAWVVALPRAWELGPLTEANSNVTPGLHRPPVALRLKPSGLFKGFRIKFD